MSPTQQNLDDKTEERSRPEPHDRRQTILDVAQEIFLEDGYSTTSMSTIARSLGGSKATLYNYFDCKEALFEAFVHRYCAEQQQAIAALRLQTHS